MFAGPWQILIVAFLVVLLFGGARFALLGKGLGEGIRNFKRGIKGSDEDPKTLTPDSSGDDSPPHG